MLTVCQHMSITLVKLAVEAVEVKLGSPKAVDAMLQAWRKFKKVKVTISGFQASPPPKKQLTKFPTIGFCGQDFFFDR